MINWVLVALTSIFTLITIVLLINSRYNDIIEPLDDEKYPIKAIYGIGFALCNIFHMDFKSKSANKIRKDANILYGEKYAEYYLRVNYAQRFSFSLIVIDVLLCLTCMATEKDRIAILGVGVLVLFIVNYYFITIMKETIKDNANIYLMQFSNVASTMALLVNAGMILIEAWEVVAKSDNDELHLQMQLVLDEVNSGMSIDVALNRFGNRCATPEIRKFTSAIVQGMDKGNKELGNLLKTMSDEVWQAKKQKILQLAELSGNKILIPILIMFIGIMIMVMAPVMSNMNLS